MMFDDLIQSCADKYGIDPDLVHAIVMHETRGNPWSMQADPWCKVFFMAREYSDRLQISHETETLGQMTRWGLMHVKGAVARENGFADILSRLLDPPFNIHEGCKELKRLFVRYGNEMDVVAAYGAGGAFVRTLGGGYGNESYVNAVYLRLRELRKLV